MKLPHDLAGHRVVSITALNALAVGFALGMRVTQVPLSSTGTFITANGTLPWWRGDALRSVDSSSKSGLCNSQSLAWCMEPPPSLYT